MTAQAHTYRSPRPICPDPQCGKVWAPDKRTARQLRAEIVAEQRRNDPVRYYQHAGGWHWTRQVRRDQ